MRPESLRQPLAVRPEFPQLMLGCVVNYGLELDEIKKWLAGRSDATLQIAIFDLTALRHGAFGLMGPLLFGASRKACLLKQLPLGAKSPMSSPNP
jgi:hypothetical protein